MIETEQYLEFYLEGLRERFAAEPKLEAFIEEMTQAFHWTMAHATIISIREGAAGLCLIKEDSGRVQFGFMLLSDEASNNESLWLRCLSHAEKMGCEELTGPVQGTTYFPYRFVTESDGSHFFSGEYFSRSDDHDFMLSQDPKAINYYRSGYRDRFDGIMAVSKPYYDQAMKEGLEIRLHTKVELPLFRKLTLLIDRIFKGNWSFKELDPAVLEQIFRQEFGKEQSMAVHTFHYEDEMIGFCRYIQNSPDTVICKTLGILPEFQKRGWGNATVYRMHEDAVEAGVKRMIYALIYDGNRVQQNMPKDDSIIFRKYASYTYQVGS